MKPTSIKLLAVLFGCFMLMSAGYISTNKAKGTSAKPITLKIKPQTTPTGELYAVEVEKGPGNTFKAKKYVKIEESDVTRGANGKINSVDGNKIKGKLNSPESKNIHSLIKGVKNSDARPNQYSNYTMVITVNCPCAQYWGNCGQTLLAELPGVAEDFVRYCYDSNNPTVPGAGQCNYGTSCFNQGIINQDHEYMAYMVCGYTN